MVLTNYKYTKLLFLNTLKCNHLLEKKKKHKIILFFNTKLGRFFFLVKFLGWIVASWARLARLIGEEGTISKIKMWKCSLNKSICQDIDCHSIDWTLGFDNLSNTRIFNWCLTMSRSIEMRIHNLTCFNEVSVVYYFNLIERAYCLGVFFGCLATCSLEGWPY